MASRLFLRAGELEVRLEPATGGCIARFDRLGPQGRRPLLRGAGDTLNDVLQAACFPLVPFANRIRGGHFDCAGRRVTLAPNMAGDASPLHGQGWLASWQVLDAQEAHAVLGFRHRAGEWPWDYEAMQRFHLGPDRLRITLSCRNVSSEPMPCALGFHPYFPCEADTRLDTTVESAWTVDADVLPVTNVPAVGHYSLENRLICGQGLDNGFDGWNGDARIGWPNLSSSLSIRCADADRFQVYSPREGGVFVAEPVQNANAALNEPASEWERLGIEMLAPGEKRSLTAEFVIEDRS
ncbi:MAG: aldose 1-epimerase [Janthinobacterium lividum]